jgi:hypothetical protein
MCEICYLYVFLAGIKNCQQKALAENLKMKGYKTKKYLITAQAAIRKDSCYVQQVITNSWNKNYFVWQSAKKGASRLFNNRFT